MMGVENCGCGSRPLRSPDETTELAATSRPAEVPSMDELEPRFQILIEYAKWTALSAVKAGSPIRDTKSVYQLLDEVKFPAVLNPSLEPISCEGFAHWHRAQTKDLCVRAKPMLPAVEGRGSEFPVGWSAKLINVYLKTAAYVGDLGRKGLRDVLHPPVDNRLKVQLVKCFRRRHPEICDAVNFHSITAIATYEEYQGIINGCRAAAEVLRCSLFEVEQLWSRAPPGGSFAGGG